MENGKFLLKTGEKCGIKNIKFSERNFLQQILFQKIKNTIFE